MNWNNIQITIIVIQLISSIYLSYLWNKFTRQLMNDIELLNKKLLISNKYKEMYSALFFENRKARLIYRDKWEQMKEVIKK